MGNIPKNTVDGDIQKFIHHSLHKHTELESFWPGKEWCRLLVYHSQKLFQWASTACNFILGDRAAGLSLRKRFELLIKADVSKGVHHPIDKLYRTILAQQFTLDEAKCDFGEAMTVILSLNEPLSITSLSALFGERLSVREVVKPLGSLLDRVLVNAER